MGTKYFVKRTGKEREETTLERFLGEESVNNVIVEEVRALQPGQMFVTETWGILCMAACDECDRELTPDEADSATMTGNQQCDNCWERETFPNIAKGDGDDGSIFERSAS